MNLKFNFDLKKILAVLRTAQPYVFGLVLIVAFGYTAFVVNGALNLKPSEATAIADPKNPAPAKITFDKPTIEAVKKLNVVQGNVPVGDLGKDDPFK